MQLTVTNIGMIKEANIELQGLTVIAGENDAGKSTVGKLLFSIIRVFSKYKDEFENDRIEFVNEKIDRIYFLLRRYSFDAEFLKDEFKMPHFYNELIECDDDLHAINDLLDKKLHILKQSKIEEDKKAEIVQMVFDIKNIYSLESNDIDIVKRALSKALVSEFGGQISNLFNKNFGMIKCTEGNNDIFEIVIEENKVKEVGYFDDLFFNDVTYIESPLVLQIHDIINNVAFYNPYNRLSYKKLNIPIHMSDLINKIQLVDDYEIEQQFSIEELLDQKGSNINDIEVNIKNIIQGGVGYKKKVNDFIYTKYGQNKKKKISIPSSNIAMGIKSLGIIQMLINSGILNDRSILIIDEPEVHLHPKWQVEYAKIIIEIVKLGIPVLINTHSPYILQALRVFSERQGCSDLVRYYLAEVIEGENSSIFEDVTKDLHKAFKKLSDPIQELVWY